MAYGAESKQRGTTASPTTAGRSAGRVDHIDFRRKAEQMHRRAQKAEAALARALEDAKDWRSRAFYWSKRASGAERDNRALKKRLDAVAPLIGDPLTRIIAIGQMFP